VSFQAILSLNTGNQASDIVLNYLNLESGDPWAEGNQCTVGIKDAGYQGDNRLLINYASTIPFVGTGEAFIFSTTPPPALGSVSAAVLVSGDLGTAPAGRDVRRITNDPLPQTAGAAPTSPEPADRTLVPAVAFPIVNDVRFATSPREVTELDLAAGLLDPLGASGDMDLWRSR
jgi:hypothetical protein